MSASERVVAAGEPVPKGGGVYRVGRPYTVAGRTYFPEENTNYTAVGIASWYGDDFHGRFTSNGEIYDKNSISAAHKTLPLPSYVRVTNLSNRRSIVVRVNDRGPFAKDREIDLSYKTAQLLGFHGRGLAKVKVDYVGRAPLNGSDDRKLLATLREGDKPATMLAENTAPTRQAAAPKPAPVEEVAEEEEETPQAPVRVATADKGFAPAFFDSRPLASSKTISQSNSQDNSTPKLMPRAPATELAAANTRLRPSEVMPAPEPAVSPVSAYAPVRYDQPAAFMNGRGLY